MEMTLKAYVAGSTYGGIVTLVKNAYGQTISLQTLDSNGSPINLTNKTSLTFNVRLLGSSTDMVSSTTVPVDSATTGLCHYVTQATDFTASGIYYAELIIAYAASSIRVRDLIIVVSDEHATSPTMYCSKTDVESYLQETAEYNDASNPTAAQVNGFIIRASRNIDLAAGHDWTVHTVTETYDAVGGAKRGKIMVNHNPVISVSQVQYWSSGIWNNCFQGQPDDPANTTPLPAYFVYPSDGKIQFYSFSLIRYQGYKVTYTYGYNSIPDDISDLAMRIAAVDVLATKAGGTISNFQVATLRLTYANDWEFGKQEELLIAGINRDLALLRRMMVGSG